MLVMNVPMNNQPKIRPVRRASITTGAPVWSRRASQRRRLTAAHGPRRHTVSVMGCMYRFLDSPDGHASPEVWEGQR